MRKSQMILCAIVLTVTVTVTAHAENLLPEKSVRCAVEVIADICSSGKIAIEFFQDNFVLSNGDVHCWFGDFSLSGRMLNQRSDHTGLAAMADLVVSEKNGDLLVGHLTYRSARDGRLPLATLETKSLEFRGGKSAIYHMQCQETSTVQDCYESCGTDVRSSTECYLRCGGW